MRRTLAGVLTVVLAGMPATAQVGVSTARPRIDNGTVVDQSASGGLAAVVRTLSTSTTDPVWIGYAVPVVDAGHDMCCWGDAGQSRLGGCRLEPGDTGDSRRLAPPAGAIQLEFFRDVLSR